MKVVVILSGGLVSQVFADQAEVDVVVVDYDTSAADADEANANLIQIPDADGVVEDAFGTIQRAVVDPELVARTCRAVMASEGAAPEVDQLPSDSPGDAQQEATVGVAMCQGDSLEACAGSLLQRYRDLLRDDVMWTGEELHAHFAKAGSVVDECFLDQTGGGVWVSTTIHQTPYGPIYIQAGDCSAQALRATQETVLACHDAMDELCGDYGELQLAEVDYDTDVRIGPQKPRFYQNPGM